MHIYCTISIYSVVTRHGRAYRNRNVVDVTHHRGLCRKHNWSRLLVWAKFGAKKRLFALLAVNFASLAHYNLWLLKYWPESPTNLPNQSRGLPKFLWCHSSQWWVPNCRIHQTCHGHTVVPNRSKWYSIRIIFAYALPIQHIFKIESSFKICSHDIFWIMVLFWICQWIFWVSKIGLQTSRSQIRCLGAR